jgi:hypothetical protein
MLLIAIAISVFVIISLIFHFWKSICIFKYFSVVLGVIIFFAVLYNVNYNNDWDVYEAIFNGHLESNDILFNKLSSLLAVRGYDYVSVYKLHIFLIGTFFFYFVSRISYADIFVVISIYLLFQTVPVSNQIRYYLAFSLFLSAASTFIIHGNTLFFVLLSILAVLSHFGIILMFPFLFLYYLKNDRKYLRTLFLFGIFLGLIIYSIVGLDQILSTVYSSYLDFDSLSSIPGGLLNNSIWILWLIFIFFIKRRLEKHSFAILYGDVKFQFLYKLSFYCIVFYPASIVIQILSHRYIAASLLVWLTFYFYSLNYESSIRAKFFSLLLFFLLITLTFSYIYYLPFILLGIQTTDSLFLIFSSNDLFNVFKWIN